MAVELSPAFTRRATVAVLLAIGATIAVLVTTSPTPASMAGVVGGDFPEFIGAGRLAATGDAAALYDPALQLEAQRDLVSTPGREAILFAYPAAVALPYRWLSELDYRVAYLLVTSMMTLAVVGACSLLRRVVRRADGGRLGIPELTGALTFLPLFIGVTGGQVTAIVLVLVAAMLWAADRQHDVALGVAAGLLAFKPQYAAVALLLLLIGRRWWALAASGASIVGLWALGAVAVGPAWTVPWLALLRRFDAVDGGANSAQEISWMGVSNHLLDGTTAVLLGGAVVAATVSIVAFAWVRSDRTPTTTAALVVPAALLCAPHALWYDAGLLVVPIAVIASALPDRPRHIALGLCWVGGLGHLVGPSTWIEPTLALVVAVMGLAVMHARRSAAADRRKDCGEILEHSTNVH